MWYCIQGDKCWCANQWHGLGRLVWTVPDGPLWRRTTEPLTASTGRDWQRRILPARVFTHKMHSAPKLLKSLELSNKYPCPTCVGVGSHPSAETACVSEVLQSAVAKWSSPCSSQHHGLITIPVKFNHSWVVGVAEVAGRLKGRPCKRIEQMRFTSHTAQPEWWTHVNTLQKDCYTKEMDNPTCPDEKGTECKWVDAVEWIRMNHI